MLDFCRKTQRKADKTSVLPTSQISLYIESRGRREVENVL